MKIYIAGSFMSQKRLRPMRDRLWAMGHEVIGTWLDECAMPTGMNKDTFDKQLAMKDVSEIISSDCIIVDLLDPSTTGGRNCEWGLALAKPKLRYLIGHNDCIFYKLADRTFSSWDWLFNYFSVHHATNTYVATGMDGKTFT